MLKPREADIPIWFLIFVVLPLVTYFLLGRWSDTANKKARINVLPAEATQTVEAMAAADVVPVGSLPNFGFHVCARCFRTATTRCSRCKSIRYCSGKCQIIHWRQGHKQECRQWKSSNIHVSPTSRVETCHVASSSDIQSKSTIHQNDAEESIPDIDGSDITDGATLYPSHLHYVESNTLSKRESHNISREFRNHDEGVFIPTPIHASTFNPYFPPNEAPNKYKSGNYIGTDTNNALSDVNNINQTVGHSATNSRKGTPETKSLKVHDKSAADIVSSKETAIPRRICLDACGTEIGVSLEKVKCPDTGHSSTSRHILRSLPEKLSPMGGTKFRKPPYTVESNNVWHRLSAKLSREKSNSGIDRKAYTEAASSEYLHGSSKTGYENMQGAKPLDRSSKHSTGKKNKELFPYEDLVKFFQCEISNMYPRGLLNCGNSCYANAVLQCLTCTKPLLVYLLRGIHSRTCSVREWCLFCELEQHVSMLLESGDPLSPSKILSNMQNIGCRIGGGNQEDAHEFLRLLIMSMQSICLDELGGEKQVDYRLQETTLIQQIFGGRLRSRVKCFVCQLESERYENIMDLTLEIHGWVESLEDALTQFTAPEDLDGDNMYRCGRCRAYVRARKQLSVHEAPNILTIVLKRFQTGKFGKINKCVTFPDMLDMIPFMTGTSDNPPLYMLYAVVVHLDTLNASFSGHYVSYVKDMQGSWFRIDDTEVQPVSLGQVMSEGAYMLFYSRSFPRPPWIYLKSSTKSSTGKPPKSSRHGLVSSSEFMSESDKQVTFGTEVRTQTNSHPDEQARYFDSNLGQTVMPRHEYVSRPVSSNDISDLASSDWSFFTSSDESSFTTESTSDSFSTMDYSDAANLDPLTSIFSPICISEYPQRNTISYRDFFPCKPKTRFFSESKGFVLDSSMSNQPLDCVYIEKKNPEISMSGKSFRTSGTKIRDRFQRKFFLSNTVNI